jgi:hypothetical protein
MGARRRGRRNNNNNSRNTHRQGNDRETDRGEQSMPPSPKNEDIGAPTGDTKTRDESRDPEEVTNDSLLVKWTKAVAFLTGGLVFVGIITAFIFSWQLHVMQRQLDAMERDQRPFMGLTDNLDPPHFRKGADDTGQIIWNWKYTNFGRGVAYKFAFNQFIKVGNGPYVAPFGWKTIAFGGDMPPGKINFSSAISPPGIKESEFIRLMGLDKMIGVLVEFEYFDGAERKQTGSFCMSHLATGAISFPNPADCKK